jgi:hypothetical protein
MPQSEWRWCNKCQGLFFGGHQTSGCCPAGGGHNWEGSRNYTLNYASEIGTGQSDWRFCHKCEGLFFGLGGGTQCPAGGGHDLTGSADYRLQRFPTAGQRGWRFCNRCYGLFYAGFRTSGWCPRPGAGGHNFGGSDEYSLSMV